MPAIEWSDTYLIGLPDLDADHRRIVALIAKVFAEAEAGAPAATVLARIDDLMGVLLPHMEKENEMMAPLMRIPPVTAACSSGPWSEILPA